MMIGSTACRQTRPPSKVHSIILHLLVVASIQLLYLLDTTTEAFVLQNQRHRLPKSRYLHKSFGLQATILDDATTMVIENDDDMVDEMEDEDIEQQRNLRFGGVGR